MKRKLRVLDLFSGIGGFSLGLERTGGFETVAFCEIDPYCRAVLKKHWPKVPVYEDVAALTAKELHDHGICPDVICGGFPCQDASVAQTKERTGASGSRTGLWKHIARLAADFPRAILVLENVPGLLTAGFGDVLAGLAALGLDAEWHCIPARRAGLPHLRDRLWIVAHSERSGLPRPVEGASILGTAEEALAIIGNDAAGTWRALERDLLGLRGSDGISVAMERRRIKPLGNAVIPQIPQAIGHAILSAEAA